MDGAIVKQIETVLNEAILKAQTAEQKLRGFSDPNRLLTPGDAAEIYGVGRRAIDKMLDNGLIPFREFNINDSHKSIKHRKIRKADADRYFASVFSKDFKYDILFSNPDPNV